jgi:hypothetical protein
MKNPSGEMGISYTLSAKTETDGEWQRRGGKSHVLAPCADLALLKGVQKWECYRRPKVNRRLVESPAIFFHESRISRLRWDCTIAQQQWPKGTGKPGLRPREGRDPFHLTLVLDRSNVNCAMISYGADPSKHTGTRS